MNGAADTLNRGDNANLHVRVNFNLRHACFKMAGTTTLSNVLDSKELDALSPSVKYKLEVALGSKVSELNDLKGKYEKLRVNSGES